MALEQYIWYEKYRPKSLDEMSIDPDHKKAFSMYIADQNIPHLIFEGIQGSGKTTMAQILMDSIPNVRMTLNASGQDRSIETMRGKVRQFAASQPPAGKIKIVFLDEADGILEAAQNSLKNTMEASSRTCRFILTCNNYDKITPPLQSRCIRYTFARFPKRRAIQLCENILVKEGITDYTRPDITEVVNRFYPDVRSVVNNLQSACISGALNLKALGNLKVDPSEVGALIKEGRIQSIRQHLAGVTSFDFMYRWLDNEFIPQFKDEQVIMAINQAICYCWSMETTIPDREINFVQCCYMIMIAIGVEPNTFK